MSKCRHVLIGNTIYEVIDRVKNEVCVLQIYEYADGFKRQSHKWHKDYEEVIYDDCDGLIMVKP